jgi:hypothetical protein
MFAVYSTEEDLSLVPAYKTTHYLGIFTDIKLAEARVENDKEENANMHKDQLISFYYIIKSRPNVAQKITNGDVSYELHNKIIYYSDSEEEEEEKDPDCKEETNDNEDNDDSEKFTNIASVLWNIFYQKN